MIHRECFLCGRNGRGDRLELHHIFGGSRRSLSDKYKLTVYLCGERCHRNGEYAAHRNKDTALYLHRHGQCMAEKNGMTRTDFIRLFGKNYLEGVNK